MNYSHRQFKKHSKKEFAYESIFFIKFETYNYQIFFGTLENSFYINKYYHQQLNSKEIDGIVSMVAKKELEALKKMID